MKSSILTLILIVIVTHRIYSQDTCEVYMFGGPFMEEANQIIVLQNGKYVSVGTSGSNQPAGTSIYVTCLDEEFNCEWNAVLGGSSVDVGNSVCETSEGEVLVCGYSNVIGQNGYDVVVHKLSHQGDVVWTKYFGGNDWDFAYKIIPYSDSQFLICGMTYSYGNGNGDGYVLKIDGDGNLLAEWTYGGVWKDEFFDIDSDGSEIYLSGYSDIDSEGSKRRNLIALSSSGVIDWTLLDSEFEFDSYNRNSVILGDLLYSCGNYFDDSGSELGYITATYIENGERFWHNEEAHNGNFVFNDLLIENDRINLLGYTDAYGDGNINGLISVKGIYGEWLNSVTIGSSYFSFNSSIANGGRMIAAVRALHSETVASVQSAVYVYPDLTFEANSETIWNSTECFVLNAQYSNEKVACDEFDLYDLAGRFIGHYKSSSFILENVALQHGVYIKIYENQEGLLVHSELKYMD